MNAKKLFHVSSAPLLFDVEEPLRPRPSAGNNFDFFSTHCVFRPELRIHDPFHCSVKSSFFLCFLKSNRKAMERATIKAYTIAKCQHSVNYILISFEQFGCFCSPALYFNFPFFPDTAVFFMFIYFPSFPFQMTIKLQ